MIQSRHIDHLILAGGQARRMQGQDKGLVPLAGKDMIAHVLDRLSPEGKVWISANRNQQRYAAYGEVLPDSQQGFLGPLAGIYTGLVACTSEWLLVAPCDAPLITPGLAILLQQQRPPDASICVASDGKRLQPVFCLLKQSLHKDLGTQLANGQRKIDTWFAKHLVHTVTITDPQCFINVNTEEERDNLEKILAN